LISQEIEIEKSFADEDYNQQPIFNEDGSV